ncbi:carboxymuconolactone decarboxylase family protein [Paenibacillus sp. 19GGS1-52]|uniref:carboxymuconolactone decarboxylase family protein n=1 Tax=Paenibacillus sp. 19GGS1-52 TaxID=2758563 RepID=UPI001EFBD396|nr:carboxymuconolactone decarboxylase family protein [Paenibacillus sp. 19GGS1-52]ULO09448.1 carboxymuconolactone decarboxylase family protein [Paenibacillus sp. 19GGS1-52]
MELRFNHQKANPTALKAMMSLEQYTSSRCTDKVLYELIKIRVSQINGCSFCLDMHAKDLLKLGDHGDRILLLSVWREVPLFTEKERAVLELAEAVANIGQAGVPQLVYDKVREFVSEEEFIDLIMAINTINSWNRIAISTGMYPGCFD